MLEVNPTARPPAHSTSSPMPNPDNEDAPHQHNTSGTHAPPSTTTPPAPTPPTKGRTAKTGAQQHHNRAP